MNKYRMYVCSVVLVTEVPTGSYNYEIVVKSDDPDCDLVPFNGLIYRDNDKCIMDATDIPAEQEPQVIKRPRFHTSKRITSNIFDSEAQARRWGQAQVETTQGEVSFEVNDLILDQDDLDEYLYKPTFTVTLRATMTKEFEVEIDTNDCQFEDIEDEWDAKDAAVTMFKEGDLSEEWRYAAEDDTDAEAIDCEED